MLCGVNYVSRANVKVWLMICSSRRGRNRLADDFVGCVGDGRHDVAVERSTSRSSVLTANKLLVGLAASRRDPWMVVGRSWEASAQSIPSMMDQPAGMGEGARRLASFA
jgi:hypothetical protein